MAGYRRKICIGRYVYKITCRQKKTNSEIAEAVLKALKWQSNIPAWKVKIKLEDSWVTFEGGVEWSYYRNSVNSAFVSIVGAMGITGNIQFDGKTDFQ